MLRLIQMMMKNLQDSEYYKQLLKMKLILMTLRIPLTQAIIHLQSGHFILLESAIQELDLQSETPVIMLQL